VGHLALPQYGYEQAALLACGERSALTARSALYLWGVVATPPPRVEVALPDHSRRRRLGVRVRRSAIDRRGIRTRHGLRVLSPADALIAFAAQSSPHELSDAVAEARVRNLIRDGELEAAADAVGTRRGGPQMRAFLREEGGPAITRSRAERRFRKLLGEAQLPRPKLNALVAGLSVDFLWDDEKVVLEVDGWQFHGHRQAFENDRKRDRILADAGYHVIRVTWRQFTEEPLALIAHIARILDRRGRMPH
jgi:very-short-patch-repair endonuclease